MRHKVRAIFDRFINAHSRKPLPVFLPLIHSTRCEYLASLLKSPTLETRPCKVFRRKLLYFFYGRPAYRVRSTGRHDIAYCPVCLVLASSFAGLRIHRIAPFDTGAAVDGRYPSVSRRKLRSYFIRHTRTAVKSLVQVIFGDNIRYLRGQAALTYQYTFPAAVNRYLTLLADPSIASADDRRSAIEIQVTRNVKLKSRLQAIALPLASLDDPDVLSAVIALKVHPLSYDTVDATSPEEYTPVIRQRVLDFYRSQSFI